MAFFSHSPMDENERNLHTKRRNNFHLVSPTDQFVRKLSGGASFQSRCYVYPCQLIRKKLGAEQIYNTGTFDLNSML